MNMVEYEILDSIDNIDSCIQESTLDVFEATMKEYEKFSQFVEFSVFEEAFYMEGKILDEATGKNTFDGTLKKIILFLPRLLIAIVKSIASVFTDKYDEEVTTNGAKASENLNNTNDPNKLAMAQENVNTISNGEIQFDPNTKKFKLGKTFSHIKNWIKILTGAAPLIEKIRTMKEGGETSYGVLAKNLKAILKGEMSIDEGLGLTSDMLVELAKDSNRASRAIEGIAREASMGLQKKLEQDFAAGKDVTKTAQLKDLSDQVSQLMGVIHKVTLFGRAAGFLCKDMGGGSIFLRKIRSKLQHDEEDKDLMTAKTKEKQLKSQIKAKKREAAKAEDDIKRISKKQEKINKLNTKNEKLEKQLKAAELKRNLAKDTIKDTHDEFYGRGLEDDNADVQESAEIEVGSKDELEEGALLDYLRTGDNGGTEIIDGKEYSKNWIGSLQGGPSTKRGADFMKKVHGSKLCEPIGDPELHDYWEKHNQDDDYSVFEKPLARTPKFS